LDAVVDDVLLELEPQSDVYAVGDLVCLDADERRLHAVDPRNESVQLDAAELIRKSVLKPPVKEAPELRAPPDEVLPKTALRFVDPEGARTAGRQVLELTRQLLRVEAMPVLVHGREERLDRLGVVVRRDPDVVDARARRKRVLGWIEAPGLRPVPEQRDDLLARVLMSL